jgi:hypothetical protein
MSPYKQQQLFLETGFIGALPELMYSSRWL